MLCLELALLHPDPQLFHIVTRCNLCLEQSLGLKLEHTCHHVGWAAKVTLHAELADPCHCLDQLQARFGLQGLEAAKTHRKLSCRLWRTRVIRAVGEAKGLDTATGSARASVSHPHR